MYFVAGQLINNGTLKGLNSLNKEINYTLNLEAFYSFVDNSV